MREYESLYYDENYLSNFTGQYLLQEEEPKEPILTSIVTAPENCKLLQYSYNISHLTAAKNRQQSFYYLEIGGSNAQEIHVFLCTFTCT